jgi:signal transduction histidine kinase
VTGEEARPGVGFARGLFEAAASAAIRAPAAAPRGWRRRPGRLWRIFGVVFSIALAVGFTGGAVAQMVSASMGHTVASFAAVLGFAQAAPLLIAGRRPLGAWRTMAIGMLAGVLVLSEKHLFWPWPVTTWLAMIVVLFLVGVGYERQVALGAGLVTALGVVLPAVVIAGMRFWFALILWGIIAIVLVFADALSGRYAAEASLAEQAALRQRDLARQAVLEERARIARDLHDVVAHHMSVIALQSEAAPYKIQDLPPAGRQTFAVIRDAAREALAETRRVVGLLRQDDEGAPDRLPRPGLDRLDELVEGARHTGLDVESRVIGVPRPLSAGTDLSAYRIVQEALSNAARYAPGSSVRVRIRYGEEQLFVSVIDDGAAGPVVPEPGGGHGLIGMRERVTMLGGTLSAGPGENAGFVVAAELPYAD